MEKGPIRMTISSHGGWLGHPYYNTHGKILGSMIEKCEKGVPAALEFFPSFIT